MALSSSRDSTLPIVHSSRGHLSSRHVERAACSFTTLLGTPVAEGSARSARTQRRCAWTSGTSACSHLDNVQPLTASPPEAFRRGKALDAREGGDPLLLTTSPIRVRRRNSERGTPPQRATNRTD